MCPHCLNSPLFLSRRRTWRDKLMRLFGRYPLTCAICHHREYTEPPASSFVLTAAHRHPVSTYPKIR